MPRYLDWLFEGLPLKGATIYDIGGGTGLVSFYVAEQGAGKVVCVEPLVDGSREGMLSDFEAARRIARNGHRVALETADLSQFTKQSPPLADILILHNVINHLDEQACRKLHTGDKHARASFLEQFRSLSSILQDGGMLVVADAGRASFWTDNRMRNPFAPTIDRSVHQQPEVWCGLLEEIGFETFDIRWTPFLSLMTSLPLGSRHIGPRSLSSYFTLGHFVLRMRKGTPFGSVGSS